MFKKQAKKFDTMDTIIGPETIIEGGLKVADSLRVDGKVYGTIECGGDIIVGETGYVEKVITARNVIVAGTVVGNITAIEKLHIHSTGKFTGKATIKALIIEEGGFYQGESSMTREVTNLSEAKQAKLSSSKTA